MAKQCWSQTVLESGSWGHSVLQTPALVIVITRIIIIIFNIIIIIITVVVIIIIIALPLTLILLNKLRCHAHF